MAFGQLVTLELILWIIQKEIGGQFSLLSKYQTSPRVLIKDKYFMLALWGSDVET